MQLRVGHSWRRPLHILNKLGKVLAENRLRNVVAEPKSTINPGRILVVNLAQGQIGEGTAICSARLWRGSDRASFRRQCLK